MSHCMTLPTAVTSNAEELLTLLTHSGRVALLARLKQLNVTPLAERQRVANTLGRMLRADSGDCAGSTLDASKVECAADEHGASAPFDFDPYEFAEVLIPANLALKGRPRRPRDMGILDKTHHVLGTALLPPWPSNCRCAVFGAGCFWGLEKGFWRLPGVYSTAVGYAGGHTPHPSYSEVCTGLTGHTEAVLVVFDPAVLAFTDLLRWFWQCHDPTQGMGQGRDRGTQYRSMIVSLDDEQYALAKASKEAYQRAIAHSGRTFTATRQVTVEIVSPSPPASSSQSQSPQPPPDAFFYAEEYHMQYLARPSGSPYCAAEPLLIDLPAYATWAPTEEMRLLHAPRLPDLFWAKHAPAAHCALNRPNSPIKLD